MLKRALVLALLAFSAHAADEPLWVMPVGRSITNSSYPLVKSPAWGLAQDLEFSLAKIRLGYVNETHKFDPVRGHTDKRDGVYAQWVGTHWLTPNLATELSFGPYITATTVQTDERVGYKDEYKLAAILGMGLRLRLGSANVMLSWQRPTWTKIAGRYADADIFGLWLGWNP